jgi:hypothetical protein
MPGKARQKINRDAQPIWGMIRVNMVGWVHLFSQDKAFHKDSLFTTQMQSAKPYRIQSKKSGVDRTKAATYLALLTMECLLLWIRSKRIYPKWAQYFMMCQIKGRCQMGTTGLGILSEES